MGKREAARICLLAALCVSLLSACGPRGSTAGPCDPSKGECLCHSSLDCPSPWECGPSGTCVLGGVDSGLPDGGGPDGGLADAAVDASPDAEVRRAFGEPCTDKLQCQSFVCLYVATGGFCSMLCHGGSCPPGYGCVGVLDAVEQGVVSDVCIPEGNLLCTQCASHAECSLIGQDLCLPDPLSGSFCARDCTTVSCPPGYLCQDVEHGGFPYRQCLPESGSCNCTAENIGADQPCDVETPFGLCQGSRECLGSQGWGPCEPPSVTDEPDGTFTDHDCDGIDGSIDGGIFVSTQGQDTDTCGLSHTSPCLTIGKGILRASVTSGRSWVYIQAGTYYEVINLLQGVHLVGGYDINWQRGPRTLTGHTVTVVGGYDSATNQHLTVRGYGVNTLTRLMDLVLVGPTALGNVGGNGRSSHVIWVMGSTGLSLERVTLQAGNGAPGVSGEYGQDASTVVATSGMNGGSGGNAQSYTTACDTTSRGAGGSAGTNSCTSGRAPSGGAGGRGGTMDTSCDIFGICSNCNATAGDSGTNAAYWVTSSHGYRGAGGSPCGYPGNGNPGLIQNGAGGNGGGSGFIQDNFWYARPGSAGGVGDNGSGGGGGGGSGGCDSGTDSYGAGGGGGGAGGCAARGGGAAGGGGGGSFGLFMVSSSVSVDECVVQGGAGGSGGAGGQGGRGQSGGSGAAGGQAAGGSKAGGTGGQGRHGGHGGGGGGGAGGVSYGVFGVDSGTIPICTFSGGAAGAGGQGGLSAPGAPVAERDGNNGISGQSAPQPSHGTLCQNPSSCN